MTQIYFALANFITSIGQYKKKKKRNMLYYCRIHLNADIRFVFGLFSLFASFGIRNREEKYKQNFFYFCYLLLLETKYPCNVL